MNKEFVNEIFLYDKMNLGSLGYRNDQKQDYQPPVTKMLQVETEGGFCASITDDEGKSSSVKATQQEYTEYDFSNATTWE